MNGAIFLFAGRIVIEDRAADCTLAVVLPVTELEVAEIPTEPRARAVATPPPAIDTTLLFDEAHVTEAVMSCELPSENVPVAVNCWRVARDKTVSAGVISIETKVALVLVLVTVRVAVEEICPALAEIVETPGERPLARPAMPPELEIVAMPVLDEVQSADAVMSLVDPSL